ncbi:MAG: nucleotidyltransferase domain-containing protein [Methanomassiliicoccales archaeon]|nr:nucleotidyltransferase domain-containing protein [Methanomassiliicoccales archaeon]
MQLPDLTFSEPRRTRLFEKLERVMDRLDRGELPMVITEVYVFGSFLRNKPRPRDLDLLLIYDSDATLKMYEATDEKGAHWRIWQMRRSPAKLRGCLKKNAEKTVDISICPSLEEYAKDLLYPMDVCLKIWTADDRDWRGKLREHFSKT